MDNLSYTYDSGNKLIKVDDASGVTQGFKDVSGNDYTYDGKGNLKTDANKGITGINYNHLNLPTHVFFNGSQYIDYKYDAAGMKLEKRVVDNSNVTTTYYAGNQVYEKVGSNATELQFFSHPEGYVSHDNGTFDYVYQYKDHLGNVRLSYADSNNDGSINPSTEIIEENNYYPFGLKHKGYNNVISSNGNAVAQKRKFGGFELQDELNLQWYDMTARNFDPALGRWMNLDPLAEQMRRHSPYNYAFNNPIYWIDPDGMAPTGNYGQSLENSAVSWSSSNSADWNDVANGEATSNGANSNIVEWSSSEVTNGKINSSSKKWRRGNIWRSTTKGKIKCIVGVDCPSSFDEYGEGTTVLDEIVLNASTGEFSTGVPYESISTTAGGNVNFLENEKLFANISTGSMRKYTPNFFGRMEESLSSSNSALSILGKAIYDAADGVYVFGTGFAALSPNGPMHLNGNAVHRGSSDHIDSGVNGMLTVMTAGRVRVKSLNAAQFSSKFKGTLARLSPAARGRINRVINWYNNKIGQSIKGTAGYYIMVIKVIDKIVNN